MHAQPQPQKLEVFYSLAEAEAETAFFFNSLRAAVGIQNGDDIWGLGFL